MGNLTQLYREIEQLQLLRDIVVLTEAEEQTKHIPRARAALQRQREQRLRRLAAWNR